MIKPSGWKVCKLNEEHCLLEQTGGPSLNIGDKVEIIPSHGCTTINLHDVFYVICKGKLEAVWPIAGRGQST